ncbi:ABC transporter permease [Actinocorallia populi]|uniref:ABC transporter permease n=1 Tax=Actinocorallia populi TaxID=2079200 RepID=UPI000D096531|nr:ABC transporter permease [Actinocorallia populi]
MSEQPTEKKAAPAGEKAPPGGLRRVLDEILQGSWLVTALAVVLALFFGAIMIIVSDEEVRGTFSYFFAAPGDALSASWTAVSEAYGALFRGAVWNPESSWNVATAIAPFSETLTEATPLLLGGLAIGLAFRSGLFNIGGQGQLIMGAICATLVGFTVQGPVVVAAVLAVLAGIAGGALYGALVGLLKARTGAHEVIVTIMLNYVAVSFLVWLITTDAVKNHERNEPLSKSVSEAAELPRLLSWLPEGGGSLRLHAGLLIAAAAVFFCWWLLNRSTLGFELRAVGANPTAARTAGMSVGRSQIMAMLISGGLMGIVGATQVLGTANANNALTPSIDAGLGFTAITVALLGRASPVGTVFAAILFGALQAGGRAMQASSGVSIEIVTVIQALIVLFVAAPPLVRGLFRLKGAGGSKAALASKGWNG